MASMTLSEFSDKYCSLCGSQLCGGVKDIEEREGCPHYRKVFMNETEQENKHKCKHKSTKDSVYITKTLVQPLYTQLRNEGYTIEETLYIIKTSATLCAVDETTK